MNIEQFNEELWKHRLANSLVGLSEAQKPFLQRFWEANGFPTKVSFNDQDETPFPSNDLLAVYNGARYSARFGNAEYFAPLTTALNPVRGVLGDHPIIARALGRRIPCDDVQIGILNSATLTSLYQFIVGQMAQNPTSTTEGFIRTASDLNFLLTAPETNVLPLRTAAANIGMNVALYFGICVEKEIDLGEGYSLFPFSQIEEYVDREWLREVAPEHVDRRRMEGVFAIVHKFRWRPLVRNKYSLCDSEYRMPPPLFHRWAEEFANVLAVLVGSRVSWIMTLEGCISRVASELLGQGHRPGSRHKGRSISHLYNPFDKLKEASNKQIHEARTLFSRRSNTAYADLAPAVYRLAEALARDGRFAKQDRILDVAVVFERIFRPPKRNISEFLQNQSAALLSDNIEERDSIKAEVKHFYDVRSAIIHGPSDAKKQQLLREVEEAWIAGARIARASLIKKLA